MPRTRLVALSCQWLLCTAELTLPLCCCSMVSWADTFSHTQNITYRVTLEMLTSKIEDEISYDYSWVARPSMTDFIAQCDRYQCVCLWQGGGNLLTTCLFLYCDEIILYCLFVGS